MGSAHVLARRWIVCVGVLLVAVGGLAMAVAASVEITHFTYSGHGREWLEYLETMAPRFEAETGVKVSFLVTGSNAEWKPKLTSMLAGGVAPDVTDGHPAIAGPFASQGVFVDLRPYIERDNIPVNQMPPAAVEGVKAPNGMMWGFPISIYPMVTFFNADMFSQMGLLTPSQLGEKWDWDAFSRSAKRLTTDTNGDGVTDIYGTYRQNWRWEMHVHQAGGKIWDRLVFPTKSFFNTPEVLKAMTWLHDLMAVNKVDSLGGSYTVWNEKAAMTLAYGPGVINTYLRNVSFNWDIASQPKGEASRAARVNPDGFQVLASSKHREAAWGWVKFIAGNVNSQLEFTKVTGRMPSLRQAMLQYPKVMDLLPENWMAFVDTGFDPASYAPYVYQDARLESLVSSVTGQVWKGQLSPEAAVQRIHEQAQALLAEGV